MLTDVPSDFHEKYETRAQNTPRTGRRDKKHQTNRHDELDAREAELGMDIPGGFRLQVTPPGSLLYIVVMRRGVVEKPGK